MGLSLAGRGQRSVGRKSAFKQGDDEATASDKVGDKDSNLKL